MVVNKLLSTFAKVLFAFAISLYCIYVNANENSYDIPAQVSIEILDLPIPVMVENKYFLVYELYIVNYHKQKITITSIEVGSNDKPDIKFVFANEELEDIIQSIGKVPNKIQNKNMHTVNKNNLTTNKDKNKMEVKKIVENKKKVESKNDENPKTIASGVASIVFMWLPFNEGQEIPRFLHHTINIVTEHENKEVSLKTTTSPILVNHLNLLMLQAPVKGDYWVAQGGLSNTSYHRRANMVIHGHDYFAQRYAIDFIQVNKNGLSHHDDPRKNENYYAYKQEIHAVADGIVISIQDGIQENVPLSPKMSVPINLNTAGGNYVITEIGANRYAFYAHMLPDSLTVKVGDKVTRGQVLGKIGNSGNSYEPHLHFHIVDKPSFLGANGIPYGFTEFFLRPSELLAPEPKYQLKIFNAEPQKYTNQLMRENSLIYFAEK